MRSKISSRTGYKPCIAAISCVSRKKVPEASAVVAPGSTNVENEHLQGQTGQFEFEIQQPLHLLSRFRARAAAVTATPWILNVAIAPHRHCCNVADVNLREFAARRKSCEEVSRSRSCPAAAVTAIGVKGQCNYFPA